MLIIEKKINYFLNKKIIFTEKPNIAVAVSGGPDSIALVFLLKKWIKKKNGKLIALIIDHKIRDNSKEEAQEVKDYLKCKGVESKILSVSKNKLLKKSMDQARKNRFYKIIDYCKKNNFFYLFLGHHYDDNIETFLIRKIAGSNFEGLNCMQNKILFDEILILRPLLSFTKKQLLNYVKINDLKFVEDPTNLNEKYSRAKIRKFLKLNLNFKKDAIKDFKLIQNNFSNYRRMVFQLFHISNLQITENSLIFDKLKFLNLDKEVQVKLVEIIYKYFNKKKPFLRYKKITNLLDNIDVKIDAPLDLAGMRVKTSNRCIHFIA
tara:strand:+ start:958 stop:1917 length:960 start_codon:yes stop_codon:yes gene_type:complete